MFIHTSTEKEIRERILRREATTEDAEWLANVLDLTREMYSILKQINERLIDRAYTPPQPVPMPVWPAPNPYPWGQQIWC